MGSWSRQPQSGEQHVQFRQEFPGFAILTTCCFAVRVRWLQIFSQKRSYNFDLLLCKTLNKKRNFRCPHLQGACRQQVHGLGIPAGMSFV
jgi:hypothetical protein